MKTSTVIAAASFLLSSFVEAAPVNKRDLVVVTTYEEVVETVEVTTTVYVDEIPATSVPAQATSSAGGYFYEQPSSAPVSTSQAQQTSAPAPSSVQVPSVAAVSSVAATSAYVAPSSVYTPPAASSTETPTSVYTPPASSSAAPAATSSSTSSGGTQYTGDVTYYNPGGNTGACGWAISDGDMAVAVASSLMGAQSNGNPWCGKTVTITHNGKSVQAKVGDKCPGCNADSLDLTPAVWSAIASDIDGHGYNINWSVE